MTILLTLLSVACFLIPGAYDALALDRGLVASGELWRLITGHFVHLNSEHLIWSLAVFAVTGAAIEIRHPRALFALPAWALAISLGALAFNPELEIYCGLSALASGLFFWRVTELIVDSVKNREPLPAALGAIGALGFALKIAFEGAAHLPVFVSSLPEPFKPLPSAHALGALCGLLQYALISTRRRRAPAAQAGSSSAPPRLLSAPSAPPSSVPVRVASVSDRASSVRTSAAIALFAFSAASVPAQSIRDLRPPPQNAAAPAPDTASDPRAIQGIFKTHCYLCHDIGGEAADALDFIASRDRLVDAALINPGHADASPLYIKMKTRKMPPRSAASFPTSEEIAAVERWINAGAPDWAKSPAPVPTPNPRESKAVVPSAPSTRSTTSTPSTTSTASTNTSDDLDRLLQRDLLSLPERDRPFARYLTLTHWLSAGVPEDELALARAAVSKLLNSLSWTPEIVRPEPLGPGGAVLRLDLRDFGWSAELWESIAAQSPYGALADGAPGREARRMTGSALPLLRADWFAALASRPPFYHDILGVPATERELEDLLRLNVELNVRQERVLRAGFNRSGVSVNNRIIERSPSPFGAYWKSYDFAGNLGRENIFENPLGPGGGTRSFAHAGTEIIFALPNGLQGYMLADAAGRRLDKAPTQIVSDPRRPDRAVENGLSCMSCHERGMIPKTDQVRPHIERNAAAFGRELDVALALYAPADRLAAALAEDEARFTAALVRAGVDPAGPEPISRVVARYESPVDLTLAAAEAGFPPEDFTGRLPSRGDLARTLGPLRAPGGVVQRQAFEAVFPALVEELGLGVSPLRGLRRSVRPVPAGPAPNLRPRTRAASQGAGCKAADFWGE